jgi:chlorophyllide a reductase subunit X
VEQVCPLESQDFFATFGANNTAALPIGASAADLFGAKAIEPLISLQEMADYGTDSLDDPTRLLVTRLFTELGLAVTTANQDPKKGLVLTVQGDITICFGNDQDIESKLAVLAALHQSGQAYRYLDLRRPAAPLYR